MGCVGFGTPAAPIVNTADSLNSMHCFPDGALETEWHSLISTLHRKSDLRGIRGKMARPPFVAESDCSTRMPSGITSCLMLRTESQPVRLNNSQALALPRVYPRRSRFREAFSYRVLVPPLRFVGPQVALL